MSRIFCIANQKGGVGKTTTTVNLAAGLAQLGKRVLLVELDPQGNATMGSGIDKRALDPSVYDVLLEAATVTETRKPSPHGGYHVLGANRELAGAEIELVELERRERRLKAALAAVRDEYDFVLIDCPPSLSMLTLNGLCAAHGVIVPTLPAAADLRGVRLFIDTLNQVRNDGLNPLLELIGVLFVQYDPRLIAHTQALGELKAAGLQVIGMIPRSVKVQESSAALQPVTVYDPASKPAQAYIEVERKVNQWLKRK